MGATGGHEVNDRRGESNVRMMKKWGRSASQPRTRADYLAEAGYRYIAQVIRAASSECSFLRCSTRFHHPIKWSILMKIADSCR